MNHRHMLLVVSVLIFAGCDEVAHQGSPAETDAFLRNALDTYGVIDVVPSAPIAAGPKAPAPVVRHLTPQAKARGNVLALPKPVKAKRESNAGYATPAQVNGLTADPLRHSLR